MRAVALRTLIGLLALAFAASGVAAHYCNVAHHVSGGSVAPAVESAFHHAGHDGDSAHQHKNHDEPGHEADRLHAGMDSDPLAMDDTACSKCCGICTLTGAVVPPMAGQAMFVVSTLEFAARSDLFSGAPPRVDPGIPRQIA